MVKWDYKAVVLVPVRKTRLAKRMLATEPTISATSLFDKDEDGNSDWDSICQLGDEGWEMIGLSPITVLEGSTAELLFVFKRPRQLHRLNTEIH
jgi:hypothetical protein